MNKQKENLSSGHLLPVSFLIVQIIVVAIYFQTTGLFAVRQTRDAQGYASFSFQSLSEILSQIRTPGYPVFLQIVKLSHISIPVAQYIAYAAAVLFFYVALCKIAQSKWRNAILAGILLHSNILINHVSDIGTDCFASALGITLVGLLIMCQTMRSHLRLLLLLGLISCAVWLVRPAYLFVIVLVPTLGGALFLACRTLSFSKIKWLFVREVVVLFAFCFIPLVAYSTLRLCVVGHFGVVSFGGYSIMGIAGQFLEKEDVEKLPKDLQPLASAVLNKKQEVSSLQPIVGENGRIQYMHMEENYDIVLYVVYLPVAKEIYGDDPPLVNSKAKQLALKTISPHKKKYAEWLYVAGRRTLDKLFIDFFWNKMNKLLALSLLILFVTNMLRRTTPVQVISPSITSLLFLIALFYYVWGMTLVILVEAPFGRYSNAVNLFFPLVVGSALIDQWNQFQNRNQTEPKG